MSVDQLYDESVEERVLDKIGADTDDVDPDEAFIKQAEPKWELQPIKQEDIRRERIWEERTVYAGHPCPVLVYAGSLPMISLRDANFNIQKNIVMTSAQDKLDPIFQLLYNWIYKHGDDEVVQEEIVEEVETPEYDVPRAIQGLARLVDDARENLSEVWSPTMYTKKKKMRLLRDKKNDFLREGSDQIARAILQHIDALVGQGHFPKHMFGDYSKHCASVKNARGKEKIVPLLDLILCAEVVMPSAEELVPRKRIDTALPSAGTAMS